MAHSALRLKILNAKDIKSERVTIPEWDVTIEVRALSGAQLMRIVDAATTVVKEIEDGEVVEKSKRDNNALVRGMVLASSFDPDTGAAIFEPADADALWEKSASPLNRLSEVCQRLNGLSETTKATEKNSVATDTAAGASA